MADEYENLGPVGGGQPPLSPLGGPSLEAEEKAIKSGKGRMLVVMILAVVLALGGLIVFMSSGGEEEAYSNFGKSINGLDRDHFDAFWGCALRGTNIDDVDNNEEMMAQIHKRAYNGRARYGAHVREECLPKLEDLEPALEGLIPPADDLQAQLTELSSSVSDLRGSWSAYVAHLETLEESAYDEEAARDQVTAITKGWYDYRRTHSELNKAIKQRLDR